MKILNIIILSGVFVTSSTGLSAQIKFEIEGKQELPAATVYIVNGTSQEIKFNLSINKQQWPQAFKLKSSQTGLAWPEDNQNTNVYIRVTTDNVPLIYRLVISNRYKLYWNGYKSRWDVAKMQAEGK